MVEEILRVEDLRVYYKSIWGDYKVVDGVTFSVNREEILGIAGESGCGKSTLVEGILRLIKPPGYIKSGRIIFEGIDLLKLPEEEMRKIRWKKLAYVPQGAMNSLNPVLRVREQIIDAILDHENMPEEKAEQLALEALKAVGLPPEVMDMYPHELSGGMRQRVCIAAAITLKPDLVIADEPVTALDVVMLRAVLETLRRLRDQYRITVMMVAHDMAVHAEITDRLVVMYAGKVVEIGDTVKIFDDPLHPYVKGLIESIPSIGVKKKIKGIPGLHPSPLNWPPGCRFHNRCPKAMDICKKKEPPLIEVEPGRFVACHLYGGEK